MVSLWVLDVEEVDVDEEQLAWEWGRGGVLETVGNGGLYFVITLVIRVSRDDVY